MDNYNTLVTKVLNNECLSAEIKDLCSRQECLNLTNADWLDCLENNVTYQDYSSFAQSLWKSSLSTNYHYEESKRQSFPVLVIGYCKLAKPFESKPSKPSLLITECEPLSKIARAMTSDFGSSIQISNNFKFNFIDCSPLACNDCDFYADIFDKKGYKLSRINQPCINDISIFDGKQVKNRFLCLVEPVFKQSFLAVLLLNINIRYSYMDSTKQKIYRIGGDILHVIGFNESKLTHTKKIKIGTLIDFPVSSSLNEKRSNQTDNVEDELENFMVENSSEKRNTQDEPKIKKRKIVEEEAGNSNELSLNNIINKEFNENKKNKENEYLLSKNIPNQINEKIKEESDEEEYLLLKDADQKSETLKDETDEEEYLLLKDIQAIKKVQRNEREEKFEEEIDLFQF